MSLDLAQVVKEYDGFIKRFQARVSLRIGV